MKVMNSNIDEFEPYDIMNVVDNVIEIRMINDIMMGEIVIIDVGHFTLAHTAKLTPMHLRKIFTAIEVS